MGIVQLTLVFGARLVVDHAAFRAVRSAAVVVDDDPRYYADAEDEPPLAGRHVTAQDLRHRLSRTGVGVDTGHIGAGETLDAPLSRRATIELAATLTLMPLSQRADASIGGAIGSEGLDLATVDAVRRTDVLFLASPDGSAEVDGYAEDDVMTVEVRYRYRCGVPVARTLVCPTGDKEIRARRSLPIHGMRIDYATWDWTS